MNQATLAWAAFKNMMRLARRDPLGAFVAVLFFPSVALRHIVITVIVIIDVGLFVSIGQVLVPSDCPRLPNAHKSHDRTFGDVAANTHGSIRFATEQEAEALTRANTGLWIGRDAKIGKLAI